MAQDPHAFRCPVCGHADEVSTDRDEVTTRCAHCAATLVLGPIRADLLQVDARLAEDGGRRRSRSRNPASG